MSKASFKRMMRERAVAAKSVSVAKPKPAAPPYDPPTDEQLANFVAAMVTGAAQADGLTIALSPSVAALMLKADPVAERGWLQRHREVQIAAYRLENES